MVLASYLRTSLFGGRAGMGIVAASRRCGRWRMQWKTQVLSGEEAGTKVRPFGDQDLEEAEPQEKLGVMRMKQEVEAEAKDAEFQQHAKVKMSTLETLEVMMLRSLIHRPLPGCGAGEDGAGRDGMGIAAERDVEVRGMGSRRAQTLSWWRDQTPHHRQCYHTPSTTYHHPR